MSMLSRCLPTVVCVAALALAAAAQSAPAEIELGRRIYREGRLPSGQPLRAVVQGDLRLAGPQLSCAACHRRSGFGSSEGAQLVPPITAPALFRSREPQRAELFKKLFQEVQPPPFLARVRALHARPAYTAETLALALREGIDPTGRVLDPLMPRYQLSDDDCGRLLAYLERLALEPDPGVSATAIHFATVIATTAPPAERQALRAVLEAWSRWKNAETRGLLQRPGHSPWYKDDFAVAAREWVLHIWELSGPSDTWAAQLADHYRAQPVFALLGGLGAEDWRTIHDFCERVELPCLFPQTELPVVEPVGAYSLYFSKGLIGEAEALARYLSEPARTATARRIVQVYRDVARDRLPAEAFRRAWRDYGLSGLREYKIDGTQPLTRAFWRKLRAGGQPALLVLWLGAEDLGALDEQVAATFTQIYLPARLLGAMPARLQALRDELYFTYPFALPQAAPPQRYRVRAWLAARRVELSDEPLQLNTWFALTLAEHALEPLLENFSRDYFIESLEHATESAPGPGVFPRLSLGPGQRFASKGSYIVKLTAAGELAAVSDWIIP